MSESVCCDIIKKTSCTRLNSLSSDIIKKTEGTCLNSLCCDIINTVSRLSEFANLLFY